MLSKAGVETADHVFPSHHHWTGKPPMALDQATAHGIVKKEIPDPNDGGDEDPAQKRLRILLQEALRFIGPDKSMQDIPFYSSLAILAKDMIAPPPEIVRNPEELQRYLDHRGQLGGAFADLLTYYEHKKNPKDFARGNDGDSARARLLVPPSLIGQGERTQPEWLYQFLLNPYPVRTMSVLRMPRFNMAKDDAKALVDYFGAVERMRNPGAGLSYPYEMIAQQDPANESYWRQKSIDYVVKLKATPFPGAKDKSFFDKKVEELQPVWQQVLKDYEAQKAEAQSKMNAWEVRAKASKEREVEAKKKLDAAPKEGGLKAEFEKLQAIADSDAKQMDSWKSALDELTARVTDSSVDKQKVAWMEKDAYITDAFRLVMNRTLCLQCHSIGPIETKNEIMGPPLTNAYQRLRPGWTERWIAHPQRFLPYESSMPPNFPADKPGQFQEFFVGTPLERIQAARDVLMIFPRASAMPVNRYWVLPLPGEKSGEKSGEKQ